MKLVNVMMNTRRWSKSISLFLVCSLAVEALGQIRPEAVNAKVSVLLPNGERWTGITPPPKTKDRKVREHPRLLITRDSIPSLKEKLADRVYAKSMLAVRASKNATDKAFLYVLFGDKQAGGIAKEALLNGNLERWPGLERSINVVQAALMYDWLHSLMTEDERQKAAKFVQSLAMDANLGSSDREEDITYYWNDAWARGPVAKTIAALALDNEWAESTRQTAYDNPSEVFGPYNGGAIDVLNSMALTSGGGHQAGITGMPGTGYESFFIIGSTLLCHCWETATGEPITQKTTFFERYPHYIAYCYLGVKPFGEWARQALEYATGCRDIEMASLAAWLIKKEGEAKHAIVPRLILGDRRIQPKSPEQLKLPTCAFLEGADMFCSRSGWDDADSVLLMFARHWDTNRYEPTSGCMALYRNGAPLLVLGALDKKIGDPTRTSGHWIWQRNQIESFDAGSTYWGELAIAKGKRTRAATAADLQKDTNGFFRPCTLVDFVADASSHRATTSYAKTLKFPISLAERTVFRSPTNPNAIEVIDKIVGDTSTEAVISLRLVDEPQLTDNSVMVPGMKIAFQSGAKKLEWEGGAGNEASVPWDKPGEIHLSARKRNGYASDREKRIANGLGNVFVFPENDRGQIRMRWNIELLPVK